MKVLALLHLYIPKHNAGAERMIHAMFRPLVEAGHEVVVQLSQHHEGIIEPYVVEGVKVFPRVDKKDPFRHLDDSHVIVTHLENTPRATVLGRMYDVPVVHVLHNTHFQSKKWVQPDVRLAVYNSEWMKADYESFLVSEDIASPPSIIVRPPVFVDEYKTAPGSKVSLVNLYKPKGAEVFYELARRMPDVEFLGVRGAYGEQIIENLPNVTILDHTPDAKNDVYGQTRVLLAPSEYESWGRVGVEAMCSGIPVIAHPTPGLRESLGAAGFFCDRDDVDLWEKTLRSLLDGRTYRSASRRASARAKDLDPSSDLAGWCKAMEVIGDGSVCISERR